MIHFSGILLFDKEKKVRTPPTSEAYYWPCFSRIIVALFKAVFFYKKFSQVSKVVQNDPEQFKLSCNSLKGRPKVNNKFAKYQVSGLEG